MLRALVGTAVMVGVAVAGATGTGTAAPVATGSAAGSAGLDPLLAAAYSLAEQQAHEQGVPLEIVSGYRTRAEQQQLWDEGIATYGSPEAARRWVLPPDESTHVTGHAIDVGPQQGAQWLQDNGNRFGLCRTFVNEWWHFELQTFPGGTCPPMVPDASVR